ncbi:MAG: type II secretion system protein J [Vulcanimicrobiota bacterium]
MNSTRRKFGYTLLEILIAMGIFFVFLVMALTLYVRVFKEYNFGDKRSALLQQNRRAMEDISLNLKKATTVIYPNENELYSPGSDTIIFSSLLSHTPPDGNPATNVVGYRLNQDNKSLEFLYYPQGFDPEEDDIDTPNCVEKISRGIQGLKFQLEDPDNPQLVTTKTWSVDPENFNLEEKNITYESEEITLEEMEEMNQNSKIIFLKTKIFIRY